MIISGEITMLSMIKAFALYPNTNSIRLGKYKEFPEKYSIDLIFLVLFVFDCGIHEVLLEGHFLRTFPRINQSYIVRECENAI